jgi:hypothetical protein
MRAIRKFRVPRFARTPLKFIGRNPPPPSPSLSDVMNALSQIQQNQAQIMSVVNAIAFNQLLVLEFESSVAETLAPSQNVAAQLEEFFQNTWVQMSTS